MALRVLARDGDGALVFDGKRFSTVSGVEAKAQLLRERVSLQLGADRFYRGRGPDYDSLKKARATPQAFATIVAAELALDGKVSSATCAPVGDGKQVNPRPGGYTCMLAARVVLRGDDEIVNLEVPVA